MMIMTSPAQRTRREGKVVVLVAVCLVPLLASVAIVMDGGTLMDDRRQVQAAADAAALAAASDLFENYPQNQGLDPQGAAKASAKANAAANGFPDGGRSTVTVHIPPRTGPHTGKAGYVEVVVEFRQQRYFSVLSGDGDLTVRARAVARGEWASFKTGILVLDLHEPEALKANGTGGVHVTNADIIVNSDDPQSVGGDGQGATLKVTNGDFVLREGSGPKSPDDLDGPLTFQKQPTPDPLAYLPEPTAPTQGLTARTTPPTSSAAVAYLKALNIKARDVGKLYILEPGRYTSMPNFTNSDVVILKQASANSREGIYYLDGTGFKSTGATIVMDPTGGTTGGVMLYNDPKRSSNIISLTGGRVVLEPVQSAPYKGILLFQRRSALEDISISGQGSMAMSGTFYAAGAALSITGSSASAADVIGSQYISRTLKAGGNGQFRVDWDPNKTAPIRRFGLVE